MITAINAIAMRNGKMAKHAKNKRKRPQLSEAFSSPEFHRLIAIRGQDFPESVNVVAKKLQQLDHTITRITAMQQAVQLIIKGDQAKLHALGLRFNKESFNALRHKVANLIMDLKWRPGKTAPEIKLMRTKIEAAELARKASGLPALPTLHFVSGGTVSSK